MTAFTAVQNALRRFGCPCVPYKYDGTETRYFTYNYADIRGGDFGDDMPGCDVVDVQVHFYLPIADPVTHAKINYLDELRNVRHILFGYGFTYPEVTIIREDETNSWHIIFECEYEEDTEE